MHIIFYGSSEKQNRAGFLMSVSARLADCNEITHGNMVNLTVNGKFDMKDHSYVLSIPVYPPENKDKANLSLEMRTNCSDVYPDDVVHLDATVAHTGLSNRECDSLMIVLHNGPWVVGVNVSVNKTKLINESFDDNRLKIIHTRGLYFEDKLSVSSNVYFSEKIQLANNVKLRLISFTLEVVCELEAESQRNNQLFSYTTANVVLHVARDTYQNVIVPTNENTKDCRVKTWRTAYQPASVPVPRDLHGNYISLLPAHSRHVTVSLGTMGTFYFVRIHLTTMDVVTFRSHILMTTDGQSYKPVEEVTSFDLCGSFILSIQCVPERETRVCMILNYLPCLRLNT
ncbi:hypothetical protein D915_009944 [Fasciola hepatica]|uniref:Uncharacterized protein n=1 Tax=Fasciola hepatica TaxID=6192 RepID=A0A4E0QWA8_FASHE|nr:hypothetical protein D915_009944 [Fasciola hepatica]